MNRAERLSQLRTRGDFLSAMGVLLITREPPPPPPPTPGQPPFIASNPAEGVEVLLAVWDDGTALGLNGMIMSAAALLAHEPRSSAQAVRDALAGNLCRCGTHLEILAAVERATRALADTARTPGEPP